MKNLGLILMGVGFSFIAGGGIPPYGFSRLPVLLDGYKRAKLEGREPTLDEQGAYSTNIAHKIGAYVVIFGGLILVIGLFIQGE
jgi:hypothetical protein